MPIRYMGFVNDSEATSVVLLLQFSHCALKKLLTLFFFRDFIIIERIEVKLCVVGYQWITVSESNIQRCSSIVN
jgi:hypothetical protein